MLSPGLKHPRTQVMQSNRHRLDADKGLRAWGIVLRHALTPKAPQCCLLPSPYALCIEPFPIRSPSLPLLSITALVVVPDPCQAQPQRRRRAREAGMASNGDKPPSSSSNGG
jgi:hypothetical protein